MLGDCTGLSGNALWHTWTDAVRGQTELGRFVRLARANACCQHPSLCMSRLQFFPSAMSYLITALLAGFVILWIGRANA